MNIYKIFYLTIMKMRRDKMSTKMMVSQWMMQMKMRRRKQRKPELVVDDPQV
jgi:hypothetical protein